MTKIDKTDIENIKVILNEAKIKNVSTQSVTPDTRVGYFT